MMIDPEYKIEEPKRGRLKVLGWTAVLLAVALIAVGTYFFTKVNRAASSESRPSTFVVARGMSTKQIAASLAETRIINNQWVFVLYATLIGATNKIQAGDYALDRTMTIKEILAILTSGKVVAPGKFTIIEGWTNKQIGQYLSDRGIVVYDEFKTAASTHEGYLFPDTYQLSKHPTARGIVSQMLSNFQTKVKDQIDTDKIIMASIVEKEVGRSGVVVDESVLQRERELVASVFYNRLAVGMPLESDATVNYITGKSDRQVSLEDSKIKSPYNTYRLRGMPPGPISNPGLGAIKAAIYPAESDYLFFLNKPDGEAVFAKTLAEHNANKAKYLK